MPTSSKAARNPSACSRATRPRKLPDTVSLGCESILALSDDQIDRVVFFRRERIKTDPVCCEVHAGGVVHYAYQEAKLWMQVVERLESLPGFMTSWFAILTEPPAPRLRFVAYDRFGRPQLEAPWRF